MSISPNANKPNVQQSLKVTLDPTIERKFVRGTNLLEYRDAWDSCEKRVKLDKTKGLVLGTPLPRRDFLTHTLVVGGTGSGKTLMLEYLQTQVNEQISKYQDRMLVYDAKGETLSLLSALNAPTIVNDPFDTRCKPWNIAADCEGVDDAEKIAEILISDEGHKNDKFFLNASRALVKGAILALMEIKPNRWNLRDLVLTLLPKKASDLIAILEQYEPNDYLIERYLSKQEISTDRRVVDDPRLSQNVLASLAADIEKYQIPAMLWHNAAKSNGTFTISEWLNSTNTLVLGSSSRARTVINTINRVLMRRIIDIIKDRDNLASQATSGYTWVFLDELKEMGKVDGLNELLSFSRSKGVAVIIGIHTVPGLKAVYGDHEASEILGLCRNKILLRTDCPLTAEYLSSLFGSTEYLETQTNLSVTNSTGKSESISEGVSESKEEGTSKSEGNQAKGKWPFSPDRFGEAKPDRSETYLNIQASHSEGTGKSTERATSDSQEFSSGNTHNISHAIVSTVLPSEFLSLPDTDQNNGIHWYAICPEACYKGHQKLKDVTGSIPQKAPSRQPVDQAVKYTAKWSAGERVLLGLELRPPVWMLNNIPPSLLVARYELIKDLRKRIAAPLSKDKELYLQNFIVWHSRSLEALEYKVKKQDAEYRGTVQRIKEKLSSFYTARTPIEKMWFNEIGKYTLGEDWDEMFPQ
jgi:Type IV secretion-system coupling protein DNA-binding domain